MAIDLMNEITCQLCKLKSKQKTTDHKKLQLLTVVACCVLMLYLQLSDIVYVFRLL